MTDLVNTIQEIFGQKTIVILGDLVADQFLNGTISRVSREAPVFILRHDTTATLPGAAGNAAVNVASLAGKPILVGFTGDDPTGELLLKELEARGVDCKCVVKTSDRTTTTKVRVLAGQHYAARQQVIRIDYENPAQTPTAIRENLIGNFVDACRGADAIIISDYNYGAVFAEAVEAARKIAAEKAIPLLIDSRFRLAEFPNATSATPNRDEVEQILGKDFTSEACSELRQRLGLEALLVTNGNEGMRLFEVNKAPLQVDAIGSSEPVDVTGAGDTVIAVYALGLASGLSFADAARIANHAGGIVVMKKRTAAVTQGELIASVMSVASALASEHAR